jgi:hypothetical protein
VLTFAHRIKVHPFTARSALRETCCPPALQIHADYEFYRIELLECFNELSQLEAMKRTSKAT